MTRRVCFVRALALVALGLAACSPETGPQTGGQTNWLVACDSSQECGGLECMCGACMASCESDAACAELPSASCVAANDARAIAMCGGQAPPGGLCLPSCTPECSAGASCVAGVCVPSEEPSVRVTIDDAARHQTLVGFGASLAYADDAIVAHPDKTALYDLLFAASGLDVLRLRNRYENANDAELLAAREIVAAASQRLGRTPFLFMSSGSPPAALKANGSRTCGGNSETCTLASRPFGGFDYAGFAEYWRASLAAYANAGIVPDYISIQNNPNWVPPAERPNDACRFLPEEGTATVTVEGAPVDVAYPGYREALAAVRAAASDLPFPPRLGAPESGPVGISEYVPRLDAFAFDALALHLYGMDATAVDVHALEAIRDLAEQRDRPVFQTEMQAGGLDTAILIHHALTAGGASTYVQNDLVSVTALGAPVALVHLTRDGFEPQGPYFALAQYARSTDPGWIRVDAMSDSTELLGSAWLAPDESALTVVLVNPGSADLDAQLVLPSELGGRLVRTEVTRTTFDGLDERSVMLDELPADGIVRVPGRSILTAALALE
jgi:glucuronoarabinoxylan endo-1,4-beta-xylanase